MSKTALVVDDSATIRKLVSNTLKQMGFEVIEASNGKEGLERLSAGSVHLIMTDLNMPVMDGLEFIRALRAEANNKFTPVVFLTTEVDDAKKEEARSAGATGWIVKPFHPDKVKAVAQRFLP